MNALEYLNRMEGLFLALGDKTRLRIINLIRGGEVCVWFFTEVLNESQPKISRHLAYLRNAGVVTTRREGKWIYYRIAVPHDPLELSILQGVVDSLDAQPELRGEYSSLLAMYAAPVEEVPERYVEIETDDYIEYEEKEEIETYLL
jgi:ArsR family transcriptional regulator